LNPNVAIGTNPHSGISGRNTVLDQGVDYPGLVRSMDIVWTEEGNEAGVSDSGILVSKIRTYKMATSLNKRVLTYTAGEGGGKLQMAESMAYNRQGLGMIGNGLAGYDFPADERRYLDFFRQHFADYRDVGNIADVAVLQSHASMAWNNDLPWQSAMLLEQALIQANVPFDIIFEDQLKDLSRYKVLALADQECLSDTQTALIREFVRAGGGLVATGKSSLYNEWRERRRDLALKDVMPAPGRNQYGRGRAAYIAEIKPAVAKPATVPMLSRYWHIPVNWQELVRELRWAAGGAFSMEIKAPLTVTSELLQQRTNSTLFVHLLNYGKTRAEGIEITLRVPGGRKVKGVEMLSPDEEDTSALRYVSKVQAVTIAVPSLRTYSVLRVSLL
jgi:hypothetical protein